MKEAVLSQSFQRVENQKQWVKVVGKLLTQKREIPYKFELSKIKWFTLKCIKTFGSISTYIRTDYKTI